MSCIECELPDLLLEITSPDEDFMELTDKAVTEGQIDSLKADLVRLLMHASSLNWAEHGAKMMWYVLWYRRTYTNTFLIFISTINQVTGGEGGIRTRGTLQTYTRFPSERLKPLSHLSEL